MPKHLRDILESKTNEKEGKDTKLKGVKKSTVRKGEPTDEYPGMGPKEQDGKDFVSKHSVEVHADRVGNGDEDYKGNTKKAKHKEQSDKVYEEEQTPDTQKSSSSEGIKVKPLRTKPYSRETGQAEVTQKPSWKPDYPDQAFNYARPLKSSPPTNEEKSCDDNEEPHEKKKKGKKLLLGAKKPIEERHMTSAEKAKEQKIKKKVDPSKMKASMQKQYGPEKGKEVYFAKIRKMAMESVSKKKKMKETTGPDTSIKMPSGKVGDNANSPGYNV